MSPSSAITKLEQVLNQLMGSSFSPDLFSSRQHELPVSASPNKHEVHGLKPQLHVHTSGARSQSPGAHLAPVADCDRHILASCSCCRHALVCDCISLFHSSSYLFHLPALCLCSPPHISSMCLPSVPLLHVSLFHTFPQYISPSQHFSNLPPPCLPSLFSSVSFSLFRNSALLLFPWPLLCISAFHISVDPVCLLLLRGLGRLLEHTHITQGNLPENVLY